MHTAALQSHTHTACCLYSIHSGVSSHDIMPFSDSRVNFVTFKSTDDFLSLGQRRSQSEIVHVADRSDVSEVGTRESKRNECPVFWILFVSEACCAV